MEQFLLSLMYGIQKIPSDKKDIFNTLKRVNAIKSYKNGYILDNSFLLGYPITKGDIVFLRSLKPLLKDAKLLGGRNLNSNEIILAKILNPKSHTLKDRRLKAKPILSLFQCQKNCIGILTYRKNQYRIDNLQNNKELPIKVSQKSLRELPLGSLFEINNNKIISVIGNIKDARYDIELTLKSYSKALEFSKEALEYAKSFSFEIDCSSFGNRVDLTNLAFITIDPDDAKDFDDAIFYDGKYLFVAIADVSYYVSANSVLDKEALTRGFSIYLPDFVLPMLPKALSNDMCSLKAGKNRLAFIWKLRINKTTLEVIDSTLFEGIIKVKQNLSYKEANAMLESHPMLESLYKITKRLRDKRLKNHFSFDNDEIKLKLDSNGLIENISIKEELESNKIIEECMLLANKQSAKLMAESNVGIYRIHDEISSKSLALLSSELSLLSDMPHIPRTKKKDSGIKRIISLQQNAKKANAELSAFIDKAIISYMPKALYSNKANSHFALGFELYSHFTSPIRRYSDIIAHRILKAILLDDKKNLKFISENLEKICSRVNFLEKEIAGIEMMFNDRKFARFFHKDDVIKCVVIDDKTPCIAKTIPHNARILLDRSYPKFSILEARILYSDIISLEIKAKVLRELKTTHI